ALLDRFVQLELGERGLIIDQRGSVGLRGLGLEMMKRLKRFHHRGRFQHSGLADKAAPHVRYLIVDLGQLGGQLFRRSPFRVRRWIIGTPRTFWQRVGYRLKLVSRAAGGDPIRDVALLRAGGPMLADVKDADSFGSAAQGCSDL